MPDYLSRLDKIHDREIFWEIADADRAAADTAECPACTHIGLVYCLDNEGAAYYRCPACQCRDYI